MAHPSERAAADAASVRAVLDRAETRLRVATPHASAAALTRSHTSDFRTVAWYGSAPAGWELAIDAEVTAAPVPPALAARYGRDSFWPRWTRAESLSKLFRVPIVLWLRRHGLRVPTEAPAVWRTLAVGDLTVSVACVPAATGRGARPAGWKAAPARRLLAVRGYAGAESPRVAG